jgi:pSer/pThr/pTyr-binding forkhead associated (FHA) protein
MLRILVTYDREEETFTVPEGEAKLGSASTNDIVLRFPGISRYHAIVRRRPGGIELIDQGSKNGILVGGKRVTHTILTPGLRAQVGAAWVEIQELSSLEDDLNLLLPNCHTGSDQPSKMTLAIEPKLESGDISSPEAALQLAYHLSLSNTSNSEERGDLLARFRTTLGAETLTSFRSQRNGTINFHEHDGLPLSEGEEQLLLSMAKEPRSWSEVEVRIKRAGALLLAGRESYFLVARFPNEMLAYEGWRRDFLRFLATRFLAPVEPLRKIGLSEIRRVLIATGGNKSETARILGITRQTIYTALRQLKQKKTS